jgi:hypothetical protein
MLIPRHTLMSVYTAVCHVMACMTVLLERPALAVRVIDSQLCYMRMAMHY